MYIVQVSQAYIGNRVLDSGTLIKDGELDKQIIKDCLEKGLIKKVETKKVEQKKAPVKPGIKK